MEEICNSEFYILFEEAYLVAMSNSILANWRTQLERMRRRSEGRSVFIYLDFDYLARERRASPSGTTYRVPPIIQLSGIVSVRKQWNVWVHATPLFRIRAFLPVLLLRGIFFSSFWITIC